MYPGVPGAAATIRLLTNTPGLSPRDTAQNTRRKKQAMPKNPAEIRQSESVPTNGDAAHANGDDAQWSGKTAAL
jgi:hypothetical protein